MIRLYSFDLDQSRVLDHGCNPLGALLQDLNKPNGTASMLPAA